MAIIYSFRYTDAKSKVSNRVLMAHTIPSTMYSGTDITELNEESRGLFIAEMEAAKDRYVERMQGIVEKYDLNHRFRQFKPENMADITTETI